MPSIPVYPGYPPITEPRRDSLARTCNQTTELATAHGSPLPIIYGRAAIAPLILSWQYCDGTRLDQTTYPKGQWVLFGWCVGEIEQVEGIYFEDGTEFVNPEFNHVHVLGTSSQGVLGRFKNVIETYNPTWTFNDNFRGSYLGENFAIAYSLCVLPVLEKRIPAFAVIKGKKVNTGVGTIYSTNPAHCLADFIESRIYGIDSRVNASSITDVANNCNAEGFQLNLIINEKSSPADYIESLRAYARCYVTREGDEVFLVPNKKINPATDAVLRVTENNIVEGTFRIEHISAEDVPNIITVGYQDQEEGDPKNWFDTKAEATVSNPLLSDPSQPPFEPRETYLCMPGWHTFDEASRYAVLRQNYFALAVHQGSFQTFDEGLLGRVGEVISIQNDVLPTLDYFRVTEINARSEGRWEISFETYTDGFYDDKPVDKPNWPIPPPFQTLEPPDNVAITFSIDEQTVMGKVSFTNQYPRHEGARYQVQWRYAGGSWNDGGTVDGVIDTTLPIENIVVDYTGLYANTNYEARVRTLSGNRVSVWSSIATGRSGAPGGTGGTVDTPPAPGAVTVGFSNPSAAANDIRATINWVWNPAGTWTIGNVEFEVEYKNLDAVPEAPWVGHSQFLYQTTQLDLYPVPPETSYLVRVRTRALNSSFASAWVVGTGKSPTRIWDSLLNVTVSYERTSSGITAHVSWNDVASELGAFYQIRTKLTTHTGAWDEHRDVASDTTNDPTKPTSLGVSFPGLTTGQQYSLALRVVYADGRMSSWWTTTYVINASTLKIPSPNKPTVTSSGKTATTENITVSWTTPTLPNNQVYEVDYRLEFRNVLTDPLAKWDSVYITTGTSHTFWNTPRGYVWECRVVTVTEGHGYESEPSAVTTYTENYQTQPFNPYDEITETTDGFAEWTLTFTDWINDPAMGATYQVRGRLNDSATSMVGDWIIVASVKAGVGSNIMQITYEPLAQGYRYEYQMRTILAGYEPKNWTASRFISVPVFPPAPTNIRVGTYPNKVNVAWAPSLLPEGSDKQIGYQIQWRYATTNQWPTTLTWTNNPYYEWTGYVTNTLFVGRVRSHVVGGQFSRWVEFTFIVNTQLPAPTITNVKQIADTVMVQFSGSSFTGANDVYQYEVRNDNSAINPWVPYGTIGGNQAKEITFNGVNSTVRHKLRLRAYRYPASGEAFSHWVEHTHYPVAQFALTRVPLLPTNTLPAPWILRVDGIGVGITACLFSWNPVDHYSNNLITYQVRAYHPEFGTEIVIPSSEYTQKGTSMTLFLPNDGQQASFRVRAYAWDTGYNQIDASVWSSYIYYTPPSAVMTGVDLGKDPPTVVTGTVPPDPSKLP